MPKTISVILAVMLISAPALAMPRGTRDELLARLEAMRRQAQDEQSPAAKSILKVKEGDNIIDFETTDFGGMKVKTADLRAGKIFVIRFTCDPATAPKDHIAAYNDLLGKHAKKLGIIEVVLQGKMTQTELFQCYEELKPAFMPVMDFDGKAAASYGVTATPITIIANEKGVITNVLKVQPNPQALHAIIEQLIKTTDEETPLQ